MGRWKRTDYPFFFDDSAYIKALDKALKKSIRQVRDLIYATAIKMLLRYL